MITKIDRPSLSFSIYEGEDFYKRDAVNEWYDKNIEPLNRAIDEAEEVVCYSGDGVYRGWHKKETMHPDSNYTHRALLLGAEPLAKETAAEVLRDLLKHQDEHWSYSKGQPMTKLLERAKAALENEEFINSKCKKCGTETHLIFKKNHMCSKCQAVPYTRGNTKKRKANKYNGGGDE